MIILMMQSVPFYSKALMQLW